MSFRISLTLLTILMVATPSPCIYAQPAKSFRTTYPQPPKVMPSDPMAVFPGLEVPEFPDKFTWKVAPPAPPRAALATPGSSTAPIYAVGGDGRFRVVGQIAYGTTLGLESFRVAGGHIFYAVPRERVGQLDKAWSSTNETLWIDGFFLTAAGLSAAAK